MSQRPKKSHKSFKTLSQPAASTSEGDEYSLVNQQSSSHKSPNKSLSNEEYIHHVANVVKYILAADQSKIPISKASIAKNINYQGKSFREIINGAKDFLLDVFGYKVIDFDSDKTGKIIICNTIQNHFITSDLSEDIKTRHVLLFLSLAHIFMSGEVCTEESLQHFLSELGIIKDGNVVSESFGNVINLIKGDFVKEKYIEVNAERMENMEDQNAELKWGERAKHELSPRSVMEFISMVYGDKNIQNWSQQYAAMLLIEKKSSDTKH